MSLDQYNEEIGEKWYFGDACENWGYRVKIVTLKQDIEEIFGEEWESSIDDVDFIEDEPLMLIQIKRFDEDGDEFLMAYFFDVKRSRHMSDKELIEFLKRYDYPDNNIQNAIRYYPGYYQE
ncbi:hypothetical protein KHC33_04080 [Methanospirillum sp. J.3.6.1-F.2.7.3]|uniref:Uncharacterized protein n=1 Tax=Methanospirillum purgamenti TaxID=2834276 RepID=A0A8E7EKH3_9EURY|nr:MULTISPECIES: hypothetical protein [Methanospirillum]MDX8551781.1 hypothetical protein [Methanospirillum hungatei]QVV89701.1 hypothetical protein KHC33_04080 [Methanospirillum sp. J.3.6.1-F.2.7.3]